MKTFLTFLFILTITHSYSQPAFYERTYGLGRGVSIEKAFNGNFIIGSHVGNYPSGQAYYFLVDGFGDTVRTMYYAPSTLSSIIQTSDSGFIFIGDTCTYRRAGIYKTDSLGNIQWQTRYIPDVWATYGSAVVQNYDGGYFLSYVDDGDGPDNFYHVLKTDASGQTLSDTVVNESIFDFFPNPKSLQLTSDSGVIIVSSHFFTESTFLVKLNSYGNTVWDKEFVDTTNTIGFISNSVIQTMDGGYLVAGYTDSMVLNGDLPFIGMILKTDVNGDSLWKKDFYVPHSSFQLISVVENSTGQFYFAGEYRNNIIASSSVFIMKTDANGDSLWTKYFSGYGASYPAGIILDSIENPMVLGWTEDTITSDKYIYLIKTDTSGNIPTLVSQLSKSENKLNVFPNPSQNNFSISLNADIKNAQVDIFNMIGEKVYSFELISKQQTVVSQLPAGIYFLKVNAGEKQFSEKLIIL